MNRIDYLDGLRGLAIALVVGFHAFSRWPEIVPFGDRYADVFIFQHGWLGVELFFLISGFVILMTLEKTQSIGQFMYKRWLRLFPAMLIATLFVYLTASFFPERPSGDIAIVDLLPGLTFLEPYWWQVLLGVPVESVEGAFWSLYVEVKFYLLSALVFFFAGRLALMVFLFAAYGLFVFFEMFPQWQSAGYFGYLYSLSVHLSFEYFGWFAAGACYYVFYRTQHRYWFALGLLASIFSAVVVGLTNVAVMYAALGITVIFALALVSPHFQKILRSRFLLMLGACSYPLYLIHENFMIAMMVKFSELAPGLHDLVYPLLSWFILVIVSTWIANTAEPWLRRVLRAGLRDPFQAKTP